MKSFGPIDTAGRAGDPDAAEASGHRVPSRRRLAGEDEPLDARAARPTRILLVPELR